MIPNTGALQGITVIDLSRVLGGPYCGVRSVEVAQRWIMRPVSSVQVPSSLSNCRMLAL